MFTSPLSLGLSWDWSHQASRSGDHLWVTSSKDGPWGGDPGAGGWCDRPASHWGFWQQCQLLQGRFLRHEAQYFWRRLRVATEVSAGSEWWRLKGICDGQFKWSRWVFYGGELDSSRPAPLSGACLSFIWIEFREFLGSYGGTSFIVIRFEQKENMKVAFTFTSPSVRLCLLPSDRLKSPDIQDAILHLERNHLIWCGYLVRMTPPGIQPHPAGRRPQGGSRTLCLDYIYQLSLECLFCGGAGGGSWQKEAWDSPLICGGYEMECSGMEWTFWHSQCFIF